MGTIGVFVIFLPWASEWVEAIGQRLLLILLPFSYLALLFVRYKQVNRICHIAWHGSEEYLLPSLKNKFPQEFAAPRFIGMPVYGICLVTDAQGYTTLSESVDPSSLVHLMNRYYENIIGPVKANGGSVEQMIGDSVLCVWSLPGPETRVESTVCETALNIVKAIEQYNMANPQHALPTRIGIHAGYLHLGHIGAMDCFECRPVGDIVNTASRLEGLNKVLGTQILISQQVAQHIPIRWTRCLGRFVLKGKTTPTEVYELMGPIPGDRHHRLKHKWAYFRQGLEAFQDKRYHEAQRFLGAIEEKFGPDGPAAFYLQQLDRCSQTDSRNHAKSIVVLDQK